MPSYVSPNSRQRAPINARLRPADFAFFCAKANEAGLSPATAGRAILEPFINYMRATGSDYITALARVNRALKGETP